MSDSRGGVEKEGDVEEDKTELGWRKAAWGGVRRRRREGCWWGG